MHAVCKYNCTFSGRYELQGTPPVWIHQVRPRRVSRQTQKDREWRASGKVDVYYIWTNIADDLTYIRWKCASLKYVYLHS